MFVWRVAHNSLANRMKIHRIGVDLDTRYPICNRLDEDGGTFSSNAKDLENVGTS
jgi:hypothetical protein